VEYSGLRVDPVIRIMSNNTKISANLMGGLGNYLFQVAAAYAYGKRYSKDLVFDYTKSSGPHNNVETYELNILNGVNLRGKLEFSTILNEPGFHFHEIPNFADNVILNGYFQSEKYFSDCAEEIRRLFTSYSIGVSDELNLILSQNTTCSVHVRRGDFAKFPEHHPLQQMSYFESAMGMMPKNSMFLVFSDDIDWCKMNFSENHNIKFVEGNRDYEDLYLMSLCNHNITSNSTFSWWGSWLNSNPQKIVVAPKNWFGTAYSHISTSDLYCPGWIVI